MRLTFKRVRQWVRFILLTLCRSFSAYSVVLTIWTYIKTDNIKVQNFIAKISIIFGIDISIYSLYIHSFVLLTAFIIMLFAYKNTVLRNTQLLQCKILDTNVILYYFQDVCCKG